MKNNNHLVSTDNKGYAAQMMERALNGGKFPLKVNMLEQKKTMTNRRNVDF